MKDVPHGDQRGPTGEAAANGVWVESAEPPGTVVASEAGVVTQRESQFARYAWALTRLSIGFVFLWAFLDKFLAFGYATGKDRETDAIDRFGDAAWLNGGSPTRGFLSGVSGPFEDVFEPMAGAASADWLFMIGLLGIGAALMLGIGMRIATATGAVLLVFMWMASLPLDTNPFMDDHLVYAIALVGLAAVRAGNTLGFGRQWARSDLVERYPILL